LLPTFGVYWTVNSTSKTHVKVDGRKITNYEMKVYLDCPTQDPQSLCCKFTSELHINTSRFLNGANVSCCAKIKDTTESQSIEYVYSTANMG